MFSFQIGTTSQEEEEASAESVALSDDFKAKLQETLQFLHQDIGQLVKNAKPIRAILEDLEGKLPESIEEALTPAAFIESHACKSSGLRSNSLIAFGKRKLPIRGMVPKLW